MILTVVEPTINQTIWVQGNVAPVLRGFCNGGVDYLCGVCREVVLAENIVLGEVWDIVFRCFSCKGLSASPSLPPGTPLPAQRIVLLAGEHLQPDTLENRKKAVFVSASSHDRRIRETGQAMTFSTRNMDSETDLESVILRARTILGDMYEVMYATHRRGQKSSTPPLHPHRLMELIDITQQAVENYRNGRPRVNVRAVSELNMMLDLIDRWRSDPGCQTIIETLKSPDNYPHEMMTLAAASHLNDVGNGVGLVFQKIHGQRIPDLRLPVNACSSMGLEIKTPLLLQKPRPTLLSTEEAEKLINKAFKKAGTGKSGQLSDQNPGTLLVGGFYLRDGDLTALLQAATNCFKSRNETYPHIAGVVIMTIRVDEKRAEGNEEKAIYAPGISYDVIENPNYTGSIKFFFPAGQSK